MNLQGTYQATARGFGFFTPEGAVGRESDLFVPPRCDGGAWTGDKVTAQVGADPKDPHGRWPKSPPWWSGPTELWWAPWSAAAGSVAPAHQRPLSQRREGGRPLRRQAEGGGQDRRSCHQLRKRQAASHGHLQAGLRQGGHPSGRRGRPPLRARPLNGTSPPLWPPPPSWPLRRWRPPPAPDAWTLRDKTVITIDGASSKDFDDAVSLEKDGQGRWVLGVHIADVSHYVTESSPLDLEAFHRGHLGVLCRPGGPHAARGPLQRYLLPQSPGGPSGPLLYHDHGYRWPGAGPQGSSRPFCAPRADDL